MRMMCAHAMVVAVFSITMGLSLAGGAAVMRAAAAARLVLAEAGARLVTV